MFWRKKRALAEMPLDLHKLACRVGIERRSTLRIKLPKVTLSNLPRVELMNTKFDCYDISIGGVCLLDPNHLSGQHVGNDVDLTLVWADGSEAVGARVVARVHGRTHLQFLNLSADRQRQIRIVSEVAARGMAMRRHSQAVQDGPSLAAHEIWSSPLGDVLIVHDDIEHLATATLFDMPFNCFRNHWPIAASGNEACRDEVDSLLAFMVNLPQPSPKMVEIISTIESLLKKQASS